MDWDLLQFQPRHLLPFSSFLPALVPKICQIQSPSGPAHRLFLMCSCDPHSQLPPPSGPCSLPCSLPTEAARWPNSKWQLAPHSSSLFSSLALFSLQSGHHYGSRENAPLRHPATGAQFTTCPSCWLKFTPILVSRASPSEAALSQRLSTARTLRQAPSWDTQGLAGDWLGL